MNDGPLSREELSARGFIVGIQDSGDGYYEDSVSATPSLNSSIAKVLVTRKPLHAWTLHPRLGRQSIRSTKGQDEGSVLDDLLVGDRDRIVVIDCEKYSKDVHKKERDDAIAAGLIPLKTKDYEAALKTATELSVRLELSGVSLQDGRKQVPLYWVEYDDKWNPVQCRGMLDQLMEKSGKIVIRDLKKTVDASPRKVASAIEVYGYDVQAEAYTSGLGKCLPDMIGRIEFEWAFVEPAPFYDVHIAVPAGSMRDLGRAKWRYAINLWSQCLRSGMWPGYGADPTRIEATVYGQRFMEELLAEDGYDDGKG